ncbi:Adaptive-response sensory-kinase SasA [subsurface metagenome]
MNFSAKLSILLLSITVSVVAVVSFVAYSLNHKALEKQIHHEMQSYAAGTLDTIDRTLFERIADMKVLSTDLIISSPESTPKQITARLIEYRNKYKTYASLSFFDLNRIRIADTSGMEIGKQRSLTSYWQDALDDKLRLNIIMSESLRTPVLHFTSLVKDKNGEAFGLVVARMPISKLHDMIDPALASHAHDDQQKPECLEIDLINIDWLLLYSNYNRKGILRDNLLEHKEFKTALAADDEAIITIRDPLEDDRNLCVHAHERGHLDFPGSGWALIVRLPVEVAFASIIQLRNAMATISIAIVVIVITASLIFSRTISKPITKLRDAAAEIGKGRLDTRIESTSKDEIGQLAVSFNAMVGDLSKTTTSMEKLNAANQQLQASEQQLKAANQQLTANEQHLKAVNQQLESEIAERKQAQEKATTIIQTAQEGFWINNLKGQFIDVNDSYCKMIGYTRAELLTMSIPDIEAIEKPEETAERIKKIVEQGHDRFETRHRRKDGKIIDIDVSVKYFNEDGGQMVVFLRDVTERKKAEGAMKQLNHELEEAVEKLGRANSELKDFVYIASHDLREPMRKISSFGELLSASLKDKLGDDEKENLGFMIDGATRMQQMIEALLTYSRVTTRGAEFETVDLNKVMEELRSVELAVKIEETGTKIATPERLRNVSCDPAQIRQLMQNLIANGLKYQKEGVAPEITIRSSVADNGMVRVEVTDNGIGIKQEQFKDVFVMFKRLHSRREYEGAGIGLAVCKKIVERHGGDIGVNSTYGQGATFWFTLPALKTPVEKQSETSVALRV